MKKMVCVMAILVLCAWTVLFSQEIRAQELRLGAISFLSGPAAQQGLEVRRGIDLATDIQNERGGILGKKINLVWADAPAAKDGTIEAERLITVEKVPLIISGMASATVVAASEVANRYSVPYFECEALSDTITEKAGKYFWRVTCRSSDFAALAVEFAKDYLVPAMGIKPDKVRVGCINEDSLASQTNIDFVRKVAPTVGLTNIVYNTTYSIKSVDLSSMVTQLKGANIDILFTGAQLPDALSIVQQLKTQKVNIKAIQGFGFGWGQPALAQALGKDLDYIFNCDYPVPDINAKVSPGLEEVKKKYKAKYGLALAGPHALTCYMEAMAIFDIIKRAGSLEPEAIAKAAWATDIPTWSTPAGWGVKFVGPGKPHPGQNERSFPYITQWMNKNQQVVWPEKAMFGKTVFPMPRWEDRGK